MEKFYSLAIPEPCNENWASMTPKEKGRFCNSCSKTVIDFTQMNTKEVQEYIHKNNEQLICGHIRQDQLDTINLKIPERIFHKKISFHKAFLLALLLTMGTTLLSCTNGNGKLKKIKSVEIVSSINNGMLLSKDSIEDNPENTVLSEIMGALEIDSTKTEEIIVVEGEIIIEVLGNITFEEYDLDRPIPFSIVENPPEFKEMPPGLSIQKKRDYFSGKIGDFVSSNFIMETTINLGLKGRQRFYTQFTIDSLGYIVDILVRAPHPKIEMEIKHIISLLPQFIPARQDGKNVAVAYSLPVIFNVDN